MYPKIFCINSYPANVRSQEKKSQSVITAEKLKVNVKTYVVSNALKRKKSRQEEPQEIYKLNQM